MLAHQLEMTMLIQTLLDANSFYHAGRESPLTDEQYDHLRLQLIELERLYPYDVLPNTITNKVGHVPIGKTIAHTHAMLSLDNVFSDVGLLSFIKSIQERYPGFHLAIEDKLDGMACSLHYSNGRLKYAVTRGDGAMGEIITDAVHFIANVPKIVAYQNDFEVRGEVVISRPDFETINRDLILANDKPLKSLRNAAVGAMKAKNPTMATQRKCQFVAYDVYGLDSTVVAHDIAMMQLQSLGFKTTKPFVLAGDMLTNTDQIDYFVERLKDTSLEFAIDGIVFKVNEYNVQEVLGFNNTAPHWAIAFKSNDMISETILNDVVWQVGRTGNITPVGHVDPVQLPGVEITNVTLHNQQYIDSLDVCIGDSIGIIRSGQVIPKVVSVIARNSNRKAIPYPLYCPSCYANIRMDGAFMKCTNVFHCKGATAERLIHASSDQCVEIKGVGDEIIKELVERKLISSITDLYKDSMAQLLANRCPNTADSRLSEFQQLITGSRVTSRERAISALSIPNIGTITARTLAAQIDRLTDLLTLTPEQLEVVDIKGVKATYFFAAMAVPYYQELITELDKLLIFEERIKLVPILTDLNFVVSGSFEGTMSRSDIEESIINHGGKLQSKVSSKTDYLILGIGGGSKVKDATRHNVRVINDVEYKDILIARSVK